jgi:hypothetical protein
MAYVSSQEVPDRSLQESALQMGSHRMSPATVSTRRIMSLNVFITHYQA